MINPVPANSADNDDEPEQWLAKYGDALFSFAVVRVNNHAVAEDLVQEAFLAAVKGRQSFDHRSARLTWLIGILKRKIIDHFRSQKLPGGLPRQVSLEDMPGDFSESGGFKRTLGKWPTDPSADLQHEEFWQVFHKCRSELPANLLAAFSLREIDQASTEEVCAELGISRSNLAVRIYRARLLIRRCLERKWFHG